MLARVVVDPGMLIAALLSRTGAPARVISLWLGGSFEMVASPHLLAELSRVLARPKFRAWVTVDEARQYTEVIARGAVMYDDTGEIGLVPGDPGDDYLVALARAARVQAIVSGDAHLLGMPDARPPVVTPAKFLSSLTE